VFDWTGVSWLAVIAAAVVGFVIGFIWFLPQVFGRQWAAASGRTLPAPGEVAYSSIAIGAVASLVTAYVLALLAGAVGATTLVDGAILGFVAWLGFIATSTVNAVLYEGRNTTWWSITAGYWLVILVVMGAVIGYLK
jgi:Protein of unknown function (DUF1761)